VLQHFSPPALRPVCLAGEHLLPLESRGAGSKGSPPDRTSLEDDDWEKQRSARLLARTLVLLAAAVTAPRYVAEPMVQLSG
jgi:hypothetical protein